MAKTNGDRVQAVEASIQEMVEIVKELSEDTIRWNPTPEEWSIMQITSHVVEAIPYWLEEINKINENPTGNWGRGLDHEGRLHAVSEDYLKTKSVDEVLEELEKVPEQVKAVVSPLTDEQLAVVAPANNPNFEGKEVQFIVDNLVVKHIEGHVGQIKRNLSKL